MQQDVFGGLSEESRGILPPICHENIPDKHLKRIEKVYRSLNGLLGISLEQWEISFMRTKNLENGISNWEFLVETLNNTVKTQDLYQKSENKQKSLSIKEKRQVIFNVLAFYLAGALTKEQLDEKWIASIVSIFEKKIIKN